MLEFDANGDFVQAWGGPGEGYEWPVSEHGIYVDHRNFVWITGNVGDDDQILKFTKNGKFVLQIGQRGQSKGNSDTRNVHRAADVVVNPKTNEVFVADGYGNRRVIVFDGDTGAFKRMWGAYGNVATDPPARAGGPGGRAGGAGPAPEDLAQFRNVHGIAMSNDGLVYVVGPAEHAVPDLHTGRQISDRGIRQTRQRASWRLGREGPSRCGESPSTSTISVS